MAGQRLPRSLSPEFRLVDLANNLDRLAESREEVLARVKERSSSFNVQRSHRAARKYSNVRTKKFFTRALALDVELHGA